MSAINQTRKYGLMSTAIIMSFLSLISGSGGIYIVFWIYAAYLSYKSEIRKLKSYLVVLIWLNVTIAIGILLFAESESIKGIIPGVDSKLMFLGVIGIPLAVKIAMLYRINSLIAKENSAPLASTAIKTNSVKTSYQNTQDISNKPTEISVSQQQNNTANPYIKSAPTPKTYPNHKNSENYTEWEDALNEYNSDKRNNGLWAKLFASNNGDESLTKAQYIKIRAQEKTQVKMEKSDDKP